MYIFFWANPPPPLSADVIYGCPKDAPYGDRLRNLQKLHDRRVAQLGPAVTAPPRRPQHSGSKGRQETGRALATPQGAEVGAELGRIGAPVADIQSLKHDMQ